MKLKPFIIAFIFLGLLFAGASIYFALQPSTVYSFDARTKSSFAVGANPNLGYASMASGIISATCFLVSGILIRKAAKTNLK